MIDPYSLPPFPTVGDFEEDKLYMMIGRVVTAWEAIEIELCMIMAAFLGDPAGETMRLYGNKRTTRGRFAEFREAAHHHFVGHPNQAREGELDTLLDEAERLSHRRSNAAHSVVLPINKIAPFRLHLTDQASQQDQYGAIPPYHNLRNHDEFGLPSYAYTAASLNDLLILIDDLWQRLRVYRRSIP